MVVLKADVTEQPGKSKKSKKKGKRNKENQEQLNAKDQNLAISTDNIENNGNAARVSKSKKRSKSLNDQVEECLINSNEHEDKEVCLPVKSVTKKKKRRRQQNVESEKSADKSDSLVDEVLPKKVKTDGASGGESESLLPDAGKKKKSHKSKKKSRQNEDISEASTTGPSIKNSPKRSSSISKVENDCKYADPEMREKNTSKPEAVDNNHSKETNTKKRKRKKVADDICSQSTSNNDALEPSNVSIVKSPKKKKKKMVESSTVVDPQHSPEMPELASNKKKKKKRQVQEKDDLVQNVEESVSKKKKKRKKIAEESNDQETVASSESNQSANGTVDTTVGPQTCEINGVATAKSDSTRSMDENHEKKRKKKSKGKLTSSVNSSTNEEESKIVKKKHKTKSSKNSTLEVDENACETASADCKADGERAKVIKKSKVKKSSRVDQVSKESEDSIHKVKTSQPETDLGQWKTAKFSTTTEKDKFARLLGTKKTKSQPLLKSSMGEGSVLSKLSGVWKPPPGRKLFGHLQSNNRKFSTMAPDQNESAKLAASLESQYNKTMEFNLQKRKEGNVAKGLGFHEEKKGLYIDINKVNSVSLE